MPMHHAAFGQRFHLLACLHGQSAQTGSRANAEAKAEFSAMGEWARLESVQRTHDFEIYPVSNGAKAEVVPRGQCHLALEIGQIGCLNEHGGHPICSYQLFDIVCFE